VSASELLTTNQNSTDKITPSQAATPSVSLSQVTRHFGRFAALRGVTADFISARLYTILGDNGAGKSTLLRIIAGLIQPTRGTVEVLGTTKLASIRSQFGYMAHAPLLYDELDALENLKYFACLYGINDARICENAIRTVGLDPTLKRRVGQYSQGMRQRLSLARAVLHDPKLLLLDEPFSNVDIVSAREMVRVLGSMRDEGRTILLVTHQPSLLEGIADEFVQMDSGRIVARSANTEGCPILREAKGGSFDNPYEARR
jgi:ABC-type multidrug transport system ATPase subunit